jgi:hypothetical protein
MIKFFNLVFIFFQIILFYIPYTCSFSLKPNRSTQRNFKLYNSESDYELAKEYYEYKKSQNTDSFFYETTLMQNLDDEDYIEFAKN